MYVVRNGEARPYEAQGHHSMEAFRLHGRDVTPSRTCWVGLSIFHPGGGADHGASPSEKIYIILQGALTLITDAGETVLNAMDSCLIEGGEERAIENRSDGDVHMLVISPS